MVGSGTLAYRVYRAATHAAAPLVYLHLHWRRLRGLEHPTRWPERFGRPSASRPPANRPLLWFHAVSLGEGLAAIPVIKHCVQLHPDLVVLLTSSTISAFEVIKDRLPHGVIYQLAPLDLPTAVDSFLGYWKPVGILLMENELWPNLIISAAKKGIAMALLNARISSKSFDCWSSPLALPLISFMLSKLSLIVPLSTMEAVRFQLLHASPSIIHFAGDLKHAVNDFDVLEHDSYKIKELQLSDRPIWMAASIHKGEEEVMLWVHKEIIKIYPKLVTILVPRHPQHGRQIANDLWREGLSVALRSRNDAIGSCTSIYIVDTLGELRTLYRATPISVIGGSFLPGLAGHNLSEAAAAGCAVLTGLHVGHFSHMIGKMLQSDPSSVIQVASREKLLEVIIKLLGDDKFLAEHRFAAKQAFSDISTGIVQEVWNLVATFFLKHATIKS